MINSNHAYGPTLNIRECQNQFYAVRFDRRHLDVLKLTTKFSTSTMAKPVCLLLNYNVISYFTAHINLIYNRGGHYDSHMRREDDCVF